MASGSTRDLAELGELSRRYGLDDASLPQLAALWDRLSEDDRAPTAVRGRREVLNRHIADSLAGLELPPVREAARIADIGSGAGVPGVVLAAALPATVWTVESQQSKCAYIAALVAAAKITNVRVICSRAEEWAAGHESHDLVVARALAAQPVVLEYAAPLLAVGGHLVEWRGRRDTEEEARAAVAGARLGLSRQEVRAVTPFAGAEGRHLHVFVKSAATPPEFPRRAGLAARRPLGG
ncbi:MAG: methyltransferase GidB [Solirubrobacterales bacterium]|jgi:16S rRNA (guanine527-N7)-methyltransferase|nr:methyltransferase GidB [Solirubrobacterales bacterium]